MNVHSTIDCVTGQRNRTPEHGRVMFDASSSTQKKKFAQTNTQARLSHVSLVTKFESSGTSKDVLRIDCTYHHSLHHKTSVARLLKAHKLQVSTSVGKRGHSCTLSSIHHHTHTTAEVAISSAPTQPTEMNNRTCSERRPKNKWKVITVASWKPPWPAWRKTNIRTNNSPQH